MQLIFFSKVLSGTGQGVTRKAISAAMTKKLRWVEREKFGKRSEWQSQDCDCDSHKTRIKDTRSHNIRNIIYKSVSANNGYVYVSGDCILFALATHCYCPLINMFTNQLHIPSYEIYTCIYTFIVVAAYILTYCRLCARCIVYIVVILVRLFFFYFFRLSLTPHSSACTRFSSIFRFPRHVHLFVYTRYELCACVRSVHVCFYFCFRYEDSFSLCSFSSAAKHTSRLATSTNRPSCSHKYKSVVKIGNESTNEQRAQRRIESGEWVAACVCVCMQRRTKKNM